MNQQPQRSFAEESLSTMIAEVDKELTNSNTNQAVIPEDFFVKVFLPMFAGDKLYLESEEAQRMVTPEKWLNLARGPFNEVRVMDAGGTVLFSVPAYYSQAVIKPLDGTGQAATLPSVTDMIFTARQFAQRGPEAMDNFMLNEMNRRSFMFNKEVNNVEDVNRWNAIFKRYNRPLIQIDTIQTNTAENAAHLASATEFDPL